RELQGRMGTGPGRDQCALCRGARHGRPPRHPEERVAYVAAGRLDGYVSLSLNAWDFGAGRILVEEAGGRVTTMTGTPLPYNEKSSVMACNPTFYEELQQYLHVAENTQTD
ncbi:hypothetical protein EN829_055710, partial [Mesorhizobium sp. M00.F.Ca.ET.186.01.1.1]